KLLSTTIDQLENIIQVSGESFEKITSDLAEKAKELNSEYNIKCEKLGYAITLFEKNSEIEKRYISLLSDFDMDTSIKGFEKLSLLMNGKNDNARKEAEEHFNELQNGLLEAQDYKKDLDIKIRKLARELYNENIAQLEIEEIKEHLYKNW
ncbi:TPA: hypothetical protein PXE18_002392, partial [Mannheimia haemolytica]|nr:hypothetical protein [Mannheimia haemolytica]HDL5576901.1 hypothetical protein [Mannheimia haemolytica]